ncbi:amidohydrolase family protein [Sphingomonas sp. LaA6.9]|uniref:N-acyl-D-amino-acid deacylase family protein n=1 Tax=Sphingomonas sp. LaA6.9 TaxID=2919914 RepID=UPI001F4F983D|nr:amidohydrolase family protein [Sphingomonas sp. LaA6.9]MCJ8157743.1 amidohydrolase family protein [Sphingomonas sp. LaA6.9]
MGMIRTVLRCSLTIASILALTNSAQARSTNVRYDIVIRGGQVIDGTGAPPIRADVAIKDGRLVRIGRVRDKGAREIDASGRYVSPGWIDMLDQSGRVLSTDGSALNKLQMGVTTLLGGEAGTPVPAAQTDAWLSAFEAKGIAVNFGSYYGTTQARIEVMGDGAGTPSADQMRAMEGRVAAAMEGGALGVANALIYRPAAFQTTDELVALAKVAARYGGIYGSHVRDESAGLVTAVDEAIAIGERSGASVEIFHFKGAYQPGWGRLLPEAGAHVEAARSRGVDVWANIYPYIAGGTGLEATLPTWVFRDGIAKVGEKLADPAIRDRLKREIAAGSLPGWANLVEASGGWKGVILANSHSEEFRRFHGRSMLDIANELGRDPTELSWEIMAKAQPHRAMALFFLTAEADIRTALSYPWTTIGSDAAAAAGAGLVDALGLPHPRAYGTFPRIVAEYVKRSKLLTLPQAVHRMTGLSARRMKLADRGLVRAGYWGDLTIFDLDRLDDRASWDQPTAIPTGIDYVLVNGELVLEHGKYTGATPGKVIRGAGYKAPAD